MELDRWIGSYKVRSFPWHEREILAHWVDVLKKEVEHGD